MSAPLDEAEIAECVAQMMTGDMPSVIRTELGWEVVAFDIGEIDITTKDGQKFRLTVSVVDSDET